MADKKKVPHINDQHLERVDKSGHFHQRHSRALTKIFDSAYDALISGAAKHEKFKGKTINISHIQNNKDLQKMHEDALKKEFTKYTESVMGKLPKDTKDADYITGRLTDIYFGSGVSDILRFTKSYLKEADSIDKLDGSQIASAYRASDFYKQAIVSRKQFELEPIMTHLQENGVKKTLETIIEPLGIKDHVNVDALSTDKANVQYLVQLVQQHAKKKSKDKDFKYDRNDVKAFFDSLHDLRSKNEGNYQGSYETALAPEGKHGHGGGHGHH